MSKTIASLSLDLDNQWSYMKTHGDEGWQEFPSYLDVVVPRVLDFCAKRELLMTVFIVGQDAALEKNHAALASISDAGHEIGNHSFKHEPWLHLYERSDIEAELAQTERALEEVTGQRPRGFRGPGFSFSQELLEVLAERGYDYDCSTFPTFLGPLARLYYFLTSRLTTDQKQERKRLFGRFREGFRTLRPHYLETARGTLVEIPVTTMPIFKVPIHVSYLLYLNKFSKLLAKTYFRIALALCRLTGVAPSLLLHPLDFLGKDDQVGLEFFPGMDLTSQRKLECVGWAVDLLASRYDVRPMCEHVSAFIEKNVRAQEPAMPVG